MRAFCVCMEQFESRVLLAAGAVDPTYSAAYEDWRMAIGGGEVHAQLDGKMLHYSHIGPFDESTQLWRTSSNGSLDTSFGTSGVINLGTAPIQEFKAQADGKIVVMMENYGTSFELRRYNANGTPDTSFGSGGKLTVGGLGQYSYYNDMAVQSDGKIIVVGQDATNGYIRRFNSNGSVDTSFAGGGVKTISPQYPMGFGWVNMGGVDIRRSDGRIVVTFNQMVHGGGETAETWVLAPNGAVEWGYEGAPMSNDGSYANRPIVDGDGSILVAGSALFYDANGDYAYHDYLMRHPAPKSTTPTMWITRPDGQAGPIYPQVDGRLLTMYDTRVQRLNYNLTVDTSFGSGGTVYLPWYPSSLALQGDGKFIIDGWERVSDSGPDADYHSIRLTGDSPAVVVGADGTLNLSGSARNDFIRASTTGGIVGVENNATGPFSFTASTLKKIVANAGDGNDTVLLSGALPNSILNGGNGNDTLTGADGADTLNPGLGNDILKGGNNRDTVTYAGRGSALLLSIDNVANDGQTGEFDNINTDIETVIGGNANDRITGSDATNALYGGPGNDVLIGKAGNDLLGGQDGNDTMDGGTGSDGFFGNTGIDTADYSNRWDALIITQDEISNDGKVGESDNLHNDVEVIKGGNLADRITGGNANNTLYGLGGNDTLIGGDGNDVIYGGVGNDQLTGSAGADSFFGEDGDDTLFVRDSLADLLLNGGNGFDSAQIDSADTNRSSIEKYLA